MESSCGSEGRRTSSSVWLFVATSSDLSHIAHNALAAVLVPLAGHQRAGGAADRPRRPADAPGPVARPRAAADRGGSEEGAAARRGVLASALALASPRVLTRLRRRGPLQKDAMKAKEAEAERKAEEAQAASDAKQKARQEAAEQAAFLKKEAAAAAKQAAQEKAAAKAAAVPVRESSSDSSKTATKKAALSSEVKTVDSRAERIAKRAAEGGDAPSLFGK
eukprot:scaffold48047_cov56-Phaeocystis_antarctica.AAC.2